MGIRELFAAGGIVMWPLLASSVAAVGLIAERARFWYRVLSRQNKVVREFFRLYRLDNVAGAINHLKGNKDLPIARIFLSALELEGATPEDFRIALESEAQAEIPNLKRFNNIFDIIVSLAPLFGLLGTVLGLIISFASINIGDLSGTKAAGVTAGISEALVSTAAGMIVAIFVLFAAGIFRGFFIREIQRIQEYGGQLEILYRRRFYDSGERSYAITR